MTLGFPGRFSLKPNQLRHVRSILPVDTSMLGTAKGLMIVGKIGGFSLKGCSLVIRLIYQYLSPWTIYLYTYTAFSLNDITCQYGCCAYDILYKHRYNVIFTKICPKQHQFCRQIFQHHGAYGYCYNMLLCWSFSNKKFYVHIMFNENDEYSQFVICWNDYRWLC